MNGGKNGETSSGKRGREGGTIVVQRENSGSFSLCFFYLFLFL